MRKMVAPIPFLSAPLRASLAPALALGLAALSSTVVAAAPPGSDPGEIERKVDALLKPLLDEDLISGSVLIARKGTIEVAKGYGLANREHRIPCEADTRYRLASMTKSFTAMGILILQEKGLLRVEDTLDNYIPGYPQGNRITLHHLLTHTSGVINYSALPDHYRVWAMPHTLEEVIARFRDQPLRFDPGAKFEYSNSGYVLLAAVIEKVSGVPYEEFMREAIFAPLDMSDTGTDSHTKVIPKRATGHYNYGEGIVQAHHLYIEYTTGAGSLSSTVQDLYKWDRALYPDRLVSKATLERAFTPAKENYGYGWFIRQEYGRRLIEHRGGINGFLTMIQRFVDDDVVVITLFNYVSTFAREVNRALAAIALGEAYEPVLIPEGVKISEEALRPLAGTYRFEDQPFVVTIEGGKLWLTDPEKKKLEGIPQNETRFYIRPANAVIRFPRTPDGKPAPMVLQQSETVTLGPRVEETPGGGAERP